MQKTLDLLFLLFAIVFLCVIIPVSIEKESLKLQKETQYAYEADELAWEIQTFHKISSSILPDATIKFLCYDESMELVDIISSVPELDFSEYFCVTFTHRGEMRGVYIE